MYKYKFNHTKAEAELLQVFKNAISIQPSPGITGRYWVMLPITDTATGTANFELVSVSFCEEVNTHPENNRPAKYLSLTLEAKRGAFKIQHHD